MLYEKNIIQRLQTAQSLRSCSQYESLIAQWTQKPNVNKTNKELKVIC